jgi:hypothetical protein
LRRISGAVTDRAKGAVIRARAGGDRLKKAVALLWRRSRIRRFEIARSPVTLFVAPEAGLSPFFSCHAMLARMISDAGHAAVVLSCGGILPICSVKFAMNIGATRTGDTENAACSRCLEAAVKVGESHDLSDMQIEAILNAGHRAEIDSIISANEPRLWETKYDDIDFGGLSLGEALRAVRKSDVTEFAADDHVLLKALLKASLSVYFSVKLLSSRLKIRQIVYFGDYAYHLPFLLFASRFGITVTHISYGYIGDIDQRYLSLRPGVAVAHALDLIDRWPAYRHRLLSPLEVDKLLEGALSRLQNHGGISTYSPTWICRDDDIRAELGLDPNKKTIVAFPSSADEIVCTRLFMRAMNVNFGASGGPFDSHDDWLEKLIKWVSGRTEFQLVVRLHPRMAAGSRFKTVASDASRSRQTLASLPENIFIEWPESKVSSYNLAEIADVAVTAWSSMALELSRFGIPVVSAFPEIGLTPVGSFVCSGRTSDLFFQEIDRLADQEASLETITESLRWTYIQHWSHLVDISDITPSYMDVPPYKVPNSASTILDVVTGGKDLVEINMARHKEDVSSVLEREAVVRSVETMIALFSRGKILEKDEGLRIQSDSGALIYRSQQQKTAELNLLLSKDGFVKPVGNDMGAGRYSKLVRRLAIMLEQSSVTEGKANLRGQA